MTRSPDKKDGKAADSVRHVRVGFTTIYLIPCTGGYLQVDTGYAGHYGTFRGEIGKIGIDPARIRYLFLTHHHDDHAGFTAEEIKDTGAALIVYENAVEPLARGITAKGDMRAINRLIRTIFAVWSLFHKYTFPPVTPRKGDIIITGDDDRTLRALGLDGTILYTPGHNDECISIVLADGSAFVGDTAMNMFGYCGTKHRPPFIKDEPTIFESWRRIKDSGAKIIYPAHGNHFGVGELIPL